MEESVKQRIRESNIRTRKLTPNHILEETARKIGLGNNGKVVGEEVRERISKSMSGEKHYRWLSDRTKLAKKQERNDAPYKEWRKKVWERDGWKCRILNHQCSGKIVAHHILGWTRFPELRYEVNNGITLCHFHHPRKRNDEIRLSPYFQELVAIKA